MAERGSREAFVTLATNDTYSLGCLVLGSSLRRVGTTRQLVVMVSKDVSQPMRSQLRQVFDILEEVDVLDSNDPINLQLLGRPDLNVTFTKLHCWRLTQFQKAVFLDADTLVIQNVDELFDREELSAAPDAGWPDCFNSGVFVFKPSMDTYQSLLDFATSQGSFDGGDQGLLNMYFSDWSTKDIFRHLPFIFNVVSQAFYSYLPAFKQFKDQVKIVHFIGATKPWHHTYNTTTREVTPLPGSGHNQEFLQLWWNIFMEQVQPALDPALIGLAGELAQLQLLPGEYSESKRPPLSDQERKLNWEKGQIDYMGADSFENIQRKLEKTLQSEPIEATISSTSSPFTASAPKAEAKASAPEPEVKAAPEPEVKATVTVPKPEVKATVPKPEVKATVPKPEVKATVPKPEVKATVTVPKPEVKATVPKPEVKATVPVPKVQATVTVPKPVAKVAVAEPKATPAVTAPKVQASVTLPGAKPAPAKPETKSAFSKPEVKPLVSKPEVKPLGAEAKTGFVRPQLKATGAKGAAAPAPEAKKTTPSPTTASAVPKLDLKKTSTSTTTKK